MLKCVASKHPTPLLNKLNKSSAIHTGPGGSQAHVDQRRVAAACNITQWRRKGGGPIGVGWGTVVGRGQHKETMTPSTDRN